MIRIHKPRTNRAEGAWNITASPKVVPIPFPPLKERKGEKSCPTIPNELISNNTSFGIVGKRYLPMKKGKKPFEKSNRKDTNPNFKPSILVILVAPMFPDPIFLTLTFFNLRANQYPKGTEP
jgi:hypothetical protein